MFIYMCICIFSFPFTLPHAPISTHLRGVFHSFVASPRSHSCPLDSMGDFQPFVFGLSRMLPNDHVKKKKEPYNHLKQSQLLLLRSYLLSIKQEII